MMNSSAWANNGGGGKIPDFENDTAERGWGYILQKKSAKGAKAQVKPKKAGKAKRSVLLWKPSQLLTDEQVDEYVALARNSFGYREEQALGLLLWHKYDLGKASLDLSVFVPHDQVNWTENDKWMYQNAFDLYGNNFRMIKDYLPDKSLASVMDYYYKHQPELREKRKEWQSQNPN